MSACAVGECLDMQLGENLAGLSVTQLKLCGVALEVDRAGE
jgi:hypothetical protein